MRQRTGVELARHRSSEANRGAAKRRRAAPHYGNRALPAVLTIIGLAVAMTACSGGGTSERLPEGTRATQGLVVLPAGSPFELDALQVTSPYGSHPLDANGGFTATVDATSVLELGVETASGELVLLGTSHGDQIDISVDSTARALLYYAIGGMWLPEEHQNRVHALLAELTTETSAVAAHLARLLAAGGNGLLEPDAALTEAIALASQALLLTPAVAQLRLTPSDYTPLSEGESSVLIHSGTTTRSGAQVLHGPHSSSILVMNEYRRPAQLLIYEVATEDADGVETAVDPVNLAGTIDVPATGQLELLNALIDVVTGESPFAPVTSPAADLFGVPGASKTHYELVLIGATNHDSQWPIVNDPRFSGEQDLWHDVYFEQALALFLDEMLLPVIETYALGKVAAIDAAKLAAFRDRTRIIYRRHLSEVGLYLTVSQRGWANAMKFALDEVVRNPVLRTDLLDAVVEALKISDRNKLNVQTVERRLASRASASAVTLAVQGLMLTGDMAGILQGLTASHWAVNWQAEVAPVLFYLSPTYVQLDTLGRGQEVFTLEAHQGVSGNFRFRWSTSGNHGTISDYFQDGTEFETDATEVFYTHNSPPHMLEGQTDTVTVEVFSLEPGATSIPPDAEPIFRQTATIIVVVDEECRGKEPWCDPYGWCGCWPEWQ